MIGAAPNRVVDALDKELEVCVDREEPANCQTINTKRLKFVVLIIVAAQTTQPITRPTDLFTSSQIYALISQRI